MNFMLLFTPIQDFSVAKLLQYFNCDIENICVICVLQKC